MQRVLADSGIDCVNEFCQGGPYGWGSCVESGPDQYIPPPGPYSQCCASADPGICLAKIQGQGNNAAETMTGDCGKISSTLSSCVSAMGTAYAAGSPSSRAKCLCFDDAGNYAGDDWDSAEAMCYKTGRTEYPNLWTAVSQDGTSWCSRKVAAVATTEATATEPQSAPTTNSETVGGGAPVSTTGDIGGMTNAASRSNMESLRGIEIVSWVVYLLVCLTKTELF
jgi:hypothetical protein